MNGNGVKQDQGKAKEEFKTATDTGHINGTYKYAKICSQQNNEEEATKCFLIAAKGNHAKAKLQAALYLEKKKADDKNCLLLVASYFRELSVISYAEAMYHYAFMIRDGIGVSVDIPRAAYHFLRAAQLDYLDSGLQSWLLLIGDIQLTS